MDRLKAFLLGILKIALALFLAGIAIAVAISGWNSIKENREKAETAPLAEAKTWPEKNMEVLGEVKVKLVTKWRDGDLYYQFNVVGYPNVLETARVRHREDDNTGFRFQLYDKDGFRLVEHLIPFNTMHRIVEGADGRPNGLSANDKFSMSADNYRNAATWTFGWNFKTTLDAPIPKPDASESPKPKHKADAPIAPAKWRNRELWRQLKKGMNQSEVEALLGPPTKIDNASVLTFWYYGYPVGGQVTLNANGTVYGWEEP